MSYYIGVMDTQNGVWGIRVPDLPGALGAGGSDREAMQSVLGAMAIIADHFEELGQPVPSPRSIDELQQDPEFLEDQMPGDMYIALPLIRESRRSVRANVSFDSGTLDVIDAASKRAGLTRSAFLASAALEKIARTG